MHDVGHIHFYMVSWLSTCILSKLAKKFVRLSISLTIPALVFSLVYMSLYRSGGGGMEKSITDLEDSLSLGLTRSCRKCQLHYLKQQLSVHPSRDLIRSKPLEK